MTDDLAGRVLAAIEETEQDARAANPGPWAFDGDDEVYSAHDGEQGDLVGDTLCYVRGKDPEATGKHIERHDPQAVLRRCAADRETVGQYIDADSECKRYTAIEKDEAQPLVERHRASISRDMWGAVAGALFGVLQRLAVVYMIASEVTDHG